MTQHTPSPAVSPALRAYVAGHAAEFLADPNVTSVGIGWKITGGARTQEVAVQFTVATKLGRSALESAGTRRLPSFVEVDGQRVPTDVVERTFAPSYRIVAEAASAERRARHDPVVPGVSVAHVAESAGTLGAIVRDRASGEAYALSNWHVFHGPTGEIGEEVVQPGPYDDPAIERNHLGRLVRSHLGVEGDCAVATIEGRGIDPRVLGLGVAPTSARDPELGETVAKSGRTTAVTHGVVGRVEVHVQLDYGAGIGERTIGGVEIEPDPARPAADSQISMGGDSGAVWLYSRDGRASDVMAGLHFGGEVEGQGPDHALACLPTSVLETLDVTLDAGAGAGERTDEGAAGAAYDPAFLAHDLPAPTLRGPEAADAVDVAGSPVVPYTHFSLTMSRSRRLARWVAWNVDGGRLLKLSRSGMRFRLDPRVPAQAQLGDEVYDANPLDRGHLARRSDLLWGPRAEAQRANSDSFHFTNIAPQLDAFNQASLGGVWGRLEDALYAHVEVEDLRISVFAGPVLAADDPEYRGVRLPREYWKVIAYVEGGALRARGFLLTQDLRRIETLDLEEFATYQVPLDSLAQRTGVLLAPQLAGAQVGAEGLDEPVRLESVADIRW